MHLRNLTSYPHLPAMLYDARGRELLVVLIKASLRLSTCEPHPDPLPVHPCDVLFDSGAVRYPADVVPSKQGTDVVIHGHVYAPNGEACGSCTAEVRVGEVRAAIRVFGRRRWEHARGGWRFSEPEPFRRLLLGMERAFGGRGFLRNPIGIGYVNGDLQCSGAEGTELPYLEHEAENRRIRSPRDRPTPAGFGAVPPQWEPRRSFRGTFDEAWERTRAPLLPEDMDPRFWSSGQLVSPEPLVGGETITLLNLTPAGRMEARVPRVSVRAAIDHRDVRPALDLVVIEPDFDRIALTLRVSADVTGRMDQRMPKVRIFEKKLVPLGQRR